MRRVRMTVTFNSIPVHGFQNARSFQEYRKITTFDKSIWVGVTQSMISSQK